MKYKCIHCSNRCLEEKSYNKKLHCSRVECESCGARLIVWYDADETKVVMIEPDDLDEVLYKRPDFANHTGDDYPN